MFDVGNNLLQGTFPPAILNCIDLRVLNININNFNGAIPEGWENIKALETIDLSENRLSGSIPSSIFKSNTIQHFLLQSNLLTGSIPTNIATLENVTKIALNHNQFKGTIPEEMANLTNIGLLHFHSNALTGLVPNVDIITDEGGNAFIADCGDPSYALPGTGSLTCDKCTMCCNSDGFCQETKDLQIHVYIICLFISPIIVAVILKFLRIFPKIDSSRVYNEDSTYCFILTEDWRAWVIYFVTITIQVLLFIIFLLASNFASNESDWNFTFRCPNNNKECKDYDTSGKLGWTLSVLVLVSYLGTDLVKCFYQLRMGIFPVAHYRLLFSGMMLACMTLLAAFTTIVYNYALAESNTDLIVNVVILLFINDIDEKVLNVIEVIAPEWIEYVSEEVRDYLRVVSNNAQSTSSFPAFTTTHPSPSSTSASSRLAPATANPTSSIAKPIANTQSATVAPSSLMFSGNNTLAGLASAPPPTAAPTSLTAKPTANTQSATVAPSPLMFSGNNTLAGSASAHSTVLTGKPKDSVLVGTSQASKFAPSSHAKIPAASNIYSEVSEEKITL